MAVLGLSFLKMAAIEREEKKTLLDHGVFVYSTVTVERFMEEGMRRVERRIVMYNERFYLLRILHKPVYTATGEWRIYEKDPYSYTGEHNGRVRRISRTDDARDDEIAKQVWRYDNAKFEEPEVSWVTDSLVQMTMAERGQIRGYRKMLKRPERDL